MANKKITLYGNGNWDETATLTMADSIGTCLVEITAEAEARKALILWETLDVDVKYEFDETRSVMDTYSKLNVTWKTVAVRVEAVLQDA